MKTEKKHIIYIHSFPNLSMPMMPYDKYFVAFIMPSKNSSLHPIHYLLTKHSRKIIIKTYQINQKSKLLSTCKSCT